MIYFQLQPPREGKPQALPRPVFARLGASIVVSIAENCVYSQYFRFGSQC